MDQFYSKSECDRITTNIKILLGAKGWTIQDLVNKSGVSYATTNLFLNKKRLVRICTLGKIANALDVSFDDLLKKNILK